MQTHAQQEIRGKAGRQEKGRKREAITCTPILFGFLFLRKRGKGKGRKVVYLPGVAYSANGVQTVEVDGKRRGQRGVKKEKKRMKQ